MQQHQHPHLSDSFITPTPLAVRGNLPSSHRPQVLQARGTVSMPTSPVLRANRSCGEMPFSSEGSTSPGGSADSGVGLDEPWDPSPTSALPAFGGRPQQHANNEADAKFNQPYPNSVLSGSTHHSQPVGYYAGGPSTARGYDDRYDDSDAGDEPPRKKRAQVRIACTHCQKACKKCSDTRPCERCVRYGFEDCVDSTRKPRKTGIKRGPYKRRSSKYALSPSTDTLFPLMDPSSSVREGYLPGQPSGSGIPWDADRPSRFPGMSTGGNATLSSGPGMPPPRPPAFTSAFSAALTGPRWVHGQRTFEPGGFPLSLQHPSDPFSRAVSPIRQTHSSTGVGGSGGMHTSLPPNFWDHPTSTSEAGATHPGTSQGPHQELDIDMSAPPSATSSAHLDSPWVGGTLPWDSQIVSAPTSPRATTWPDLLPGASSAEPPSALRTTATPWPGTVGPENARFAPGVHSPAMIALKKIRKPSLRTLMSPLSSNAPSRAASPVGGAQMSPTLFDGGTAALDDDLPAMSWHLPDGGESGDPPQEDSRPMEGLGMTLAHVFQT